MSKLTPKKYMPAGWIVAVAALAAIGVGVAASAGSGSSISSGHRRASVSTVAPRAVSTARTAAPAAHDRIHAKYAALPLAFEKNEGQAGPQIQYVARGRGYKLGLKHNQAIMTLPGKKRQSEVRDMMMNKRRGAAGVRAMMKKRGLTAHHSASTSASVEMNLLGADPHARLVAENLQHGNVSYLLGKDPSKWISNVPLYGSVAYRGVYPGVDLAFHGAGQRLEFDYLVSPGADASRIALSFQGADSLQMDHTGNLILATSAGPLQLNKPIAYQSKDGERELVDAKFVLAAKNQVTFELGSYDRNRELVIDPTVTYSTYFGGDGADYGVSVATDAAEDIFVAGATDSTSIPGGSPSFGGFDSFVTKIDITGAFFTVIFGGDGDDFPGGVAVDDQGSIYVAGTTSSDNFPATVGQTFEGGTSFGNNDAYAIKFDLSGNLLWGTYIAGTDSDSAQGVAVDSAHNVYVAGETFSIDLGGFGGGFNALPSGTAVNLGTGPGSDDGYIVKLNSSGAYALVSYIGGSDGDLATGVALDGSGNIYVAGVTFSSDFPTTLGVVQSQCGSDGTCGASTGGPFDDAFVVSIKANLSGYNYVTYYGGSDTDDAYGIAADPSGNAYITGRTQSPDFPTAGSPFQDSLLGTQNAFLVKLNSSGTAASYSSYFGGDVSDAGLSVAVDTGTTPNAYITGQTTSSSASFPLVNPLNTTEGGNSDAFVSVFGLSQGQILFSTFLGGGGEEDQFLGGIAVDAADNIYVTGDTDSGNGTTDPFPTTTGALDDTYGGGSCMNSTLTVPCTDAFITAYSPATAQDFVLSVSPLSPSSVNAGGSATSTITVTNLNGYAGTVNLTCSVTGGGAPLPACSLTSTALTVTTTGAASAMNRSASGIYYAMWLPVVGLSLVGMRFASPGTRKKKFLGFLLLGLIMTALFFLPACGGSSNNGGGGGGCSGCTPAGNYTVTVTGTDSANANLTHSVDLGLTVN